MRVPSIADICKVCGAVPLPGVTESHDESLLAVKVRLPPPVFVTLTADGAGFMLVPCVPVNVVAEEDSDNTGVGAAILKVTVMIAGEPSAPAAVTVMCPV